MEDDLKFLMAEEVNLTTRIKVLGVGGGGSNAVGRMLQEGLSGIEFYILNTDKQALAASPVANKLAVGKKLASGSNCGLSPVDGQARVIRWMSRRRCCRHMIQFGLFASAIDSVVAFWMSIWL